MDLLQNYAGAADASSSNPSTTPPATPPPAAARTVVTGTIERINLSPSHFDAHERLFARKAAAVTLAAQRRARARVPADAPTLAPSSPARKRARGSSLRGGEDKQARAEGPLVPTSELHAAGAADFQGRSWTEAPPRERTFADLETYTPYIPKRCVREWRGAHAGGVSVVRFSPQYGHLLLSAGMDGVAKVWRTEEGLARSYRGHAGGVRDVCWGEEGKFLTGGWGGGVRMWDVESGRVVGSYATGGGAYCVRFTPGSAGREFLVGCGDRKVLQIDVRDANKVVQEYDQHMGAVNSIAFVEDDRRFVSSADDKVLRVWEYGIPVVIKYVSDPLMHSMPVTALHPNRKWLACQSMDNHVLVYSARDRFKQNAKKRYKGHLVAGYACGLSFSADGRFLASGDSLGRMFFWDWKTTRMFRTVQAHKKVCIGAEWHPTKPSLVASCGWDGDIKLWD